jgi:flagellar basal body-associated protein FliL
MKRKLTILMLIIIGALFLGCSLATITVVVGKGQAEVETSPALKTKGATLDLN